MPAFQSQVGLFFARNAKDPGAVALLAWSNGLVL
jgi:hypothetical protein